jgi:hypothetical protein
MNMRGLPCITLFLKGAFSDKALLGTKIKPREGIRSSEREMQGFPGIPKSRG